MNPLLQYNCRSYIKTQAVVFQKIENHVLVFETKARLEKYAPAPLS